MKRKKMPGGQMINVYDFSNSNDNQFKLNFIDREFHFPCPGCGKKIVFDYKSINVNCFTKGTITIPKFLTLKKGCTTPHCEWGKVK